MKNIHLLETDKPSKLFIIDQSGMFIPKPPYLSFSTVGGRVHKVEGSELYKPQHIYITNEESLTLGGYHFNSKYGDEPQKTNKRDIDSRKYWEEEDYYISKIILTNDPKLIADGVQEIDEEFLKWYVNNPDCEFVEVEEFVDNWKYSITVLQDKIMQRFIKNAKHKGKSLTTEEVMEGRSSAYEFIKFDETVEEAAEKFVNNTRLKNPKSLFCEGAKWQKEQNLLTHECKKDDDVFNSLRRIYEHRINKKYTEEEILKAQQAILGNIKDAVMNKNYIVEYLGKYK